MPVCIPVWMSSAWIELTLALSSSGVIDTPMTRPNMDVLGPAISIAPMDRAGTAQEVADCVLFLCSSKATFVQGSAM